MIQFAKHQFTNDSTIRLTQKDGTTDTSSKKVGLAGFGWGKSPKEPLFHDGQTAFEGGYTSAISIELSFKRAMEILSNHSTVMDIQTMDILTK